jgi:hypothetical protein
MERYEAEPVEELDSDPLQYWRDHASKAYPLLSKLAKQLLAVPATSCPSERLFSAAGCIVTKRRAALTAKHAEQIISLYEWSRRCQAAQSSALVDDSNSSSEIDTQSDETATSDRDCEVILLNQHEEPTRKKRRGHERVVISSSSSSSASASSSDSEPKRAHSRLFDLQSDDEAATAQLGNAESALFSHAQDQDELFAELPK